MAAALRRYQAARDRYDALNGDQAAWQAERALERVGLAGAGAGAVALLSGGERNLLSLARALLGDPGLLVLDEPGNHLDYAGLEWLEEILASFSGGVLLVSHNRRLLDRTVTRILELTGGRIREYRGNYTDYRLARLQALVAQRADYVAASEANRPTHGPGRPLGGGGWLRIAVGDHQGAAAHVGQVEVGVHQEHAGGQQPGIRLQRLGAAHQVGERAGAVGRAVDRAGDDWHLGHRHGGPAASGHGVGSSRVARSAGREIAPRCGQVSQASRALETVLMRPGWWRCRNSASCSGPCKARHRRTRRCSLRRTPRGRSGWRRLSCSNTATASSPGLSFSNRYHLMVEDAGRRIGPSLTARLVLLRRPSRIGVVAVSGRPAESGVRGGYPGLCAFGESMYSLSWRSVMCRPGNGCSFSSQRTLTDRSITRTGPAGSAAPLATATISTPGFPALAVPECLILDRGTADPLADGRRRQETSKRRFGRPTGDRDLIRGDLRPTPTGSATCRRSTGWKASGRAGTART